MIAFSNIGYDVLSRGQPTHFRQTVWAW